MNTASVPVLIHPSQFPDAVTADLAASLRSRAVNHKFHYDTVKQTGKWMALHQAFSPAVTDPGCLAVYDQAGAAAVAQVRKRAELVGLGCGTGSKDAPLLRALGRRGIPSTYLAVDSSVPMTLLARQNTTPSAQLLVCDLASSLGAPLELLNRPEPGVRRLVTFYGMIPNFEPDRILPVLSSLLAPDDILLLSANLAPGGDYAAGARAILPLYDNALTRDWLMLFLLDLGFEATDGDLGFTVQAAPQGSGLLRIEANYRLRQARQISAVGELFRFQNGENIRLFFSYRHTPQLVQRLLDQHEMTVDDQWINDSGEEGVFLARKRP